MTVRKNDANDDIDFDHVVLTFYRVQCTLKRYRLMQLARGA